jgi:hypothetical protein
MAHRKLFVPAILKFETTPCNWSAGPSGRLFCHTQEDSKGRFIDPLQVREDFMRLDSNTDEVLKLLNNTGLFYGGRDPHPVSIEAVREWRMLLRKLMLEPDFRQWERLLDGFSETKVQGVFLESHLSLCFDWDKMPPEVLMSERTTLGAILATIHLDHFQEATFNICVRCNAPFVPKSGHKTNYCSYGCSHAEGQKLHRNRQRAQRQMSAQSVEERA